MWLFKKAKVTDSELIRLRKILSELRFRFTSLPHFSSQALIYKKAWGDFVISNNSIPIFNGIFNIDPLIQASELKLLIDDYRSLKSEGILWLSDDLVSYQENSQVLKEKSLQLIDEEYDLAINLNTFNVPFFFKNSMTLIEVESEKQIEEWVNLFINNFGISSDAFEYLCDMVRVRNKLQDCQFKFFLSKRKDKNIGTVVLGTFQDVTAIYGLSITKEFRSMGSGTMIMASVINYVKDMSGKYLIGNSNKAGYNIYRKARSLIHLSKTQIYNIEMQKNL